MKGHVPAENLDRYRRRIDLANKLDRLGNEASGMGLHNEANTIWAQAATIKTSAQQLRADVKDRK